VIEKFEVYADQALTTLYSNSILTLPAPAYDLTITFSNPTFTTVYLKITGKEGAFEKRPILIHICGLETVQE
jgi:hypothetical protein